MINLNRRAPKRNWDLETNYDVGSCRYFPSLCTNSANNRMKATSSDLLQCSVLIIRLLAGCFGYNFLPHNSFLSPNCKLRARLFILIILKAKFLALNMLNRFEMKRHNPAMRPMRGSILKYGTSIIMSCTWL